MVVDMTGVVNILDRLQESVNLIPGVSCDFMWFRGFTSHGEFTLDDLKFVARKLSRLDWVDVLVRRNKIYYSVKLSLNCTVDDFNDKMELIREGLFKNEYTKS